MASEFKFDLNVKDVIKRKSSCKRGYNREWQRVRLAYLRKHPLCVEPGCNALACVVDHRVSLEQGGARYDHENLQGFCTLHHNRKTNRYDGGFGNQRREYS